MNMKDAFKDVLRFLIIYIIMMSIVTVGFYGFYLGNDDQTTVGWRLWGLFLALLVIVIPVSQFWMKQLYNLFNIEEL